MVVPATGRLRVRVALTRDPGAVAVDAVVRPADPRLVEVGCSVVRPGTPPVIEVGSPEFTTRENTEYLLSRAYRGALEAADSIAARTIAMPTELTWRAWPLEAAIRVALGTLESTPTCVREVVVLAPTPAALEAWTEQLARR